MKDKDLKIDEIEDSHTLGGVGERIFFLNYEEMKRKVNRILIYECQSSERPRPKCEGSTHHV